MQLVLDTNGLMVKKRNECFYIIGKKARRMISPVKIKSIAVLADCLISSSAIKLAARHAIPILFFNKSGKAESRLWSARFGSIATIRRKQVLFADQKEATQWLIQLFELKAKHQIDNLNFVKNRKPSLAIKLVAAIEKMEQYTTSFDSLKDKKPEACRNQFLGIEGSIAKAYWAQIALAMPENLTFEYRTRRPAKDPFNVLLNYGYGMLYGVIEGAVLAVGLDPHLGILHVDAYNKPTFTFDLIEPFRPWIDRLLLEQVFTEKIDASFFEHKEKGLWLNKEGKRFIIPLFNDLMAAGKRFDTKNLSCKNHIHRYAGLFAQALLKP